MKQTRKSGSGFTIVEVIVSLLILSMLMLATLSAIRTFGETQLKVEGTLQRMSETRQVIGFLRESLSQAVPVRSRIEKVSDFSSFFKGSSKEVMWVAPATFGVLGGVYIFHLTVVDEKLLLQFVPYSYDSKLPSWNSIAVNELLDDVSSFEVSYRYDAEADWLNEWDWGMSNPAFVRIVLKRAERYLPEIIIRLNDGQARIN